jgi:hypothetical protein
MQECREHKGDKITDHEETCHIVGLLEIKIGSDQKWQA